MRTTMKKLICALLFMSAIPATFADNPVITDVFTADPAPLVHGDTVYVYVGQDEAEPDQGYVMNRWLVFSSKDMVTWTSHGSPLKPADFEWSTGSAWAGHVVEKDGRFYWYVTCDHKAVHGKAIGVAVSDTPTGPFEDARGTALITNDMTKATEISWDDIDPAAFVDDDGQAWLFWGNQKAYYAKLKSNMVELDGPINVIPDEQVPRFTEAPWIHKRGDLYYLSYATGFPEKTAYATANSISGPWTYRGLLAEGAANSNTIHQGIIDFKGRSYFFYHTGMVQHPNAGGSYRRSIAIDYLHYNEDGTIRRIVQTTEGVGSTAAVNGNPVVAGYYADPEIIYSGKEDKYFLYPTTDGFAGWSGTYFETFSSPDLVRWTNEGVILDLQNDVSWADRNAWAPAAIEIKVDSGYKYFYYFTAAQKIGVAVADDPAGPFVDSGKPLVDFKPDGVDWGQEIDPDVFHDPVSGRNYLYWGNGYLAVAELNEDMVSLDRSTVRVMTPDDTFREGTEVFYRDGKYYFLWSENDTRDPDYRVRYATSDSPLGPLEIPEDNLVIARDDARGIYGTGHNSVINIPGSDEWFIVYHRFSYPDGLSMGEEAGFHREVCIDRLVFNEDGSIARTQPTLEGVNSIH